MIITLTLNPSIDRELAVQGELERGGVRGYRRLGDQAGGKDVNVARAVGGAGLEAVAILPAPPHDPFVQLLAGAPMRVHAVPSSAPVRINLTLTEPGGTTTKLNAAGERLDLAVEELLIDALLAERRAHWVVLAGSLPAGSDPALYAQIVARLRAARPGVRIAVDTAGAPLAAIVRADARVDLVKPNAHELAELLGDAAEGDALEADPAAAALAARRLLDDHAGLGAVLLTLGGGGAVLVTRAGSWRGVHPPVAVRSTVGAGDSALSGYLIAAERDLPEPDRLAWAVAYGAAAVSLPGSEIPTIEQVDPSLVTTTPLPVTAAEPSEG